MHQQISLQHPAIICIYGVTTAHSWEVSYSALGIPLYSVVRVLEGAELEAFLADRAAMQAEQEAREEAAAEKAAAKAAILERLGLTEEELATVLS